MSECIKYKLNIQYSNGITDVLDCKCKQEVALWQSLLADASVKNWLLIDALSGRVIDRLKPPVKYFY